MKPLSLALALFALAAASAGVARDAPPAPFNGVAGIAPERLQPAFWIAKLDDGDEVLLDPAAIAARNARLLELDPSMRDLDALPAQLTRAQVREWIEDLADAPDQPLFDERGNTIAAATIAAIVDARALDAIPESQPARHGLVVRRAALRSFPTALRVFSERAAVPAASGARAGIHSMDIDRFQESALFPGDRVVIVHASHDGRWRFVLSRRYAAWIEADALAEGTREAVRGYAEAKAWRVVTGATAETAYSPELPAVSRLQLDMGLRLPLAEVAPGAVVNGQNAYTAWAIDLPVRGADGRLAITPALLPRSADSAAAYLPLTRANLIGQGFKFLGERYGWGHAYGTRDCSGFVAEVYRSMGLDLPRNTRDQAVSTALQPRTFGAADSPAARIEFARGLDVGDLVYIPGHVMMVIGAHAGEPWVIHDTSGISWRDARGGIVREKLNGVAVTPLLPLMFDRTHTYVERMTSVVRLVPGNAPQAAAIARGTRP